MSRAEAVPVQTSDLIGLWRTLSYRRRLLVAVGHVAEPSQVLTLLPGSHSSLLLMASRQRLVEFALVGAGFLSVSPLTSDAILDLLAVYAGPVRASTESDQLRALADACRRHPLTAHLLGAQLAARPQHSQARPSELWIRLVVGAELYLVGFVSPELRHSSHYSQPRLCWPADQPAQA